MTADSHRTMDFAFLTSGPRMSFSIDSDFDNLPRLSSPVNLYKDAGGRSWDFIPEPLDNHLTDSPDFPRVETLADKDGRVVEVYERLEPPTTWWLRWSLSKGYLYTFLRDSDGLAMASFVASRMSVVETQPSGLPYLAPDLPLAHAAAAEVGFGEEANFSSPSRPNWGLSFRRPAFLREGRVMAQPDSDLVVLRAGTGYGIDITLVSGTDEQGGREMLDRVRNSLGES